MAFSPDGKTVVVSARDALCGAPGRRMKRRGLFKVRSEVSQASKTQVESLVFSPDGGLVATASRQGVLYLESREGCSAAALEGFRKALAS